ncbi:hypothetical protein HZB60_11105 [candidate division KSB1 bacterium]|nr:hypothetical protein [candidate division KSB1 bacterium]
MRVRFKIAMMSVTVLAIFASSAFAGTNGGLAGAFGRVGAGARAKAMGNAYTGLAEGISALYFNPGALPFQDRPQFGISASKMALDRSVQYLALAAPVRPKAGPDKKVVNAGIGVGWLHAGVGDIDSRSFDGEPLEMIDMSSNLFLFSFGVQFHEKLGGGVTAKVVYETYGKISDNNRSVNGDGFGVDAGLFGKPMDHLTLGLQLKDIGTKTTWNTTDYWSQGSSKPDKWPVQYRVGAAYDYEFLTGAVDLEGSTENETRLHAGVEARTEISERESVAARLGLDHDSFNLGLGLEFAIWKVRSMIDVVYTLETVAPDDAQTLGWGVKF